MALVTTIEMKFALVWVVIFKIKNTIFSMVGTELGHFCLDYSGIISKFDDILFKEIKSVKI